jgi:hypothetical protein
MVLAVAWNVSELVATNLCSCLNKAMMAWQWLNACIKCIAMMPVLCTRVECEVMMMPLALCAPVECEVVVVVVVVVVSHAHVVCVVMMVELLMCVDCMVMVECLTTEGSKLGLMDFEVGARCLHPRHASHCVHRQEAYHLHRVLQEARVHRGKGRSQEQVASSWLPTGRGVQCPLKLSTMYISSMSV